MQNFTVKLLNGDLFNINTPIDFIDVDDKKQEYIKSFLYFSLYNNEDILLIEQIKLEQSEDDNRLYYAIIDTLDTIDIDKIFNYLISYKQNGIWNLLTKYLQYLSDKNLLFLSINNNSIYELKVYNNIISKINIPNFSRHKIEFISNNKVICRYPFFNNIIGLFIIETVFYKDFIDFKDI